MELNNLDIDGFEQIFTEATLKKGLSSCKNGTVNFIEKNPDKLFIYQVHSKEINSVSFLRKSNLLTNINCSCKKSKCEHMAAVIFFIEKEKFEIEIKPRKDKKITTTSTKKIKSEPSLKEILLNTDLTKLLDFIEDYAKSNSDFDKLLRAKITLNEDSINIKDLKLSMYVLLAENNFYKKTDSAQDEFISNWIEENKLNENFQLNVLALSSELIKEEKDKKNRKSIADTVFESLEKQIVIYPNYLKITDFQEELLELCIRKLKNLAKFNLHISPLLALAIVVLKDKHLAKFNKALESTQKVKYGNGKNLTRITDYFKKYLISGGALNHEAVHEDEKSEVIICDTTMALVLGNTESVNKLVQENENLLRQDKPCPYAESIYLCNYFNLPEYKKIFLTQSLKASIYSIVATCEHLKEITTEIELDMFLNDAFNYLINKSTGYYRINAVQIAIFAGWHDKVVKLNAPTQFGYGDLMRFVKILPNPINSDYKNFLIAAISYSYKQHTSYASYEYHLKLISALLDKLIIEERIDFLKTLSACFHPSNRMSSALKLLIASYIKVK